MSAEKGDKTQQVGEGWDRTKMNKMWGEFRIVGKRVTTCFFKMKRKGIGENNEKQIKLAYQVFLKISFEIIAPYGPK